MPRIPFDTLPDHARLWSFAASRPLEPAERDTLLEAVDRFLDAWAAHGVPLTCARDWRYDRFLLVGVDEATAGVSGCSIDALTHLLREAETRFGVRFLDRGLVQFRDGAGSIQSVPRTAFASLADRGAVTGDTLVFDHTVTSVEAVRDGRWETAARHSWHGRAFLGAPPPPLSPA